MLAGLSATVVLPLLMVLKATMGRVLQLDLPKMLTGMEGSPDLDGAGAKQADLRAAFIAREGQQMFPLAEAPEIDAADLIGFAETLLPAAVDEAATAIPSMAVDSSRVGRGSSFPG